jgi:hypothetical protein
VYLDNGLRSAQTDSAAVVNVQAVGWRVTLNGEGCSATGDIVNRKLVEAPVRLVINRDLPIPSWKGSRIAGVLELDSKIVFFQPQRVKSKTLSVNTIKTNAHTTLRYHIVGMHDVRLSIH